VGKTQAQTLNDPGAKGKLWTAKVTIAAPLDESIRDATFTAIADLGDGTETYQKPSLSDIDAEWTGFRPGAGAEEPLPNISEQEKYQKLMDEPSRSSKTTILYFHGGAYYLCGFGTHREQVSKLAKTCNGRAFAVGYRLAPQNAFPSQLLDALNSYLYLLYPPSGALHEPVPASDIVFAGDSAGGNLVFALLQLVLQLHRTKPANAQNPTVRYNGKVVEVPLPAGASANSGWFDITRSMPSLTSNAKYDYLPPADHDDALARFPKDEIWPTAPPRGDLFCDLSMLCHPLVSPLAAKDWSNAPPLWIETGEELLTDEDCVVAVRAASQGVKVHFEQYEAMPHCFAMLLPTLATSKRCIDSWGSFCRKCTEGTVKTNGIWIAARTGLEKEVDVTKVANISFEDAVERMRDAQRRRFAGYEKEGKAMPNPSL
jgi:acetyl esterase/lipase